MTLKITITGRWWCKACGHPLAYAYSDEDYDDYAYAWSCACARRSYESFDAQGLRRSAPRSWQMGDPHVRGAS